MTITLTREEAQQALDALVSSTGELHLRLASPTDMQLVKNHKAIQALRTALAQPEHVHANDILEERVDKTEKKEHVIDKTMATRIATQLGWVPKKEWRGLTYADLYFWGGELGLGELGKGVLRAVDAHLKEKNCG